MEESEHNSTEANPPTKKASVTDLPEPKLKFNFDAKWLLLGVVILSVLITTAMLTTKHPVNTGTLIESTIDADNGDLKINWNRYPTYEMTLDSPYTITNSGTYHLTGVLNDDAIIIDAGTNVVRLILDNVTINNPTGPAIACYSAEDLVIELVGGNTITDGSGYSSDYDDDVTGAIYSKADLTFQGSGALRLIANYQDGIVSKDDLKFNSGAYEITATDDGIRGKDSVYIVGGTFDITANKGNGIKSTNETDTGKGFVLIEGGNIKIAKSYEGIEARNVIINDGSISIIASDDGINAGGGASTTTTSATTGRPSAGGMGTFDINENCTININGGNVYINASGDGVDSNGYVYFNGGKVVIDGPINNGNGALDSGINIIMTGGTVIAVGMDGMAETLGQTSTVYNASIYFPATESAVTTVEIKNSTGTTVISHTSAKAFNHMAVGTTDFTLGETYTIYINNEEYDSFTISDITTTVGNSSTNQLNFPGDGNPNGSNHSNAPTTPNDTTNGGNITSPPNDATSPSLNDATAPPNRRAN